MKRYADSTVRKAAMRLYAKPHSGITVEPDAKVQATAMGGGYFVHAVLWVNAEHVTGQSREEAEAAS